MRPGVASLAFFAGDEGHPEHAERERRQRDPGLQRVVLEDHLEVDRKDDHRAAERDLLEHLLGDPEPKQLRAEEARVDQRRLSLALAPHEPPDEQRHRQRAEEQELRDGLASLLPDEDPEHEAAHRDDREHGSDDVDPAGAGVRNVSHEPDA